MFVLQVKESFDHSWTTIWCSRPNDTFQEALLRFVEVVHNIESAKAFEPDTQYRIVPSQKKDFEKKFLNSAI